MAFVHREEASIKNDAIVLVRLGDGKTWIQYNRKNDSTNESRPGVVSELITSDQTVKTIWSTPHSSRDGAAGFLINPVAFHILLRNTRQEGRNMNQTSVHGDPAFFEQWAIYQSVIANNYMFHAEIIDIMHQQFSGSGEPLSVLDLGCGDAYIVSNSVPTQRELHYHGIDNSGMALNIARQNLTAFQGDIRLTRNDFLRELEQARDTFDVIVCSYTLHHLPRAGKRRLLALAGQRLTAAGVFIFYDVETGDAETQDAYKQRMYTVMRQEWRKLDANSLQGVINHIEANDQPESIGFYRQAFRENGLRNVEKPFRDPNGLFSLYLLRP